MGTRCNIRITDTDGNRLWLYRHWDGYASCTGVDIAQTLKKIPAGWRDFGSLINALLDKRYEQQSYETKPKRIYEVTTAEHGDIEWKYEIRLGKRGVTFKVSEFSWKTDEWTTTSYTEKQFRAYCAKELVEVRKRIWELKSKKAA